MSRLYVLIYANALSMGDTVLRALDNVPEINYWRSDFPKSAFLVTDLDSDALVTAIRKAEPVPEPFMVFEIRDEGTVAGWAPPETWSFIRSVKRGPWTHIPEPAKKI